MDDGADDATFADVLNSFSFGGRSRRRVRTAAPYAETPVPPGDPGDVGDLDDLDDLGDGPAYAPPDEPVEVTVEEVSQAVRPYTWTGGRTRSSLDLRLETLVSVRRRAPEAGPIAQQEHQTIVSLCASPVSVAEIGAHLSVPIGVARVMVSDMTVLGLVSVHHPPTPDDAAGQLDLMERVLSGLRRL